MSPEDSPAKVLIFSFAALLVLVILAVMFFYTIKDPSGFFRSVEIWIEENL